MHADEARGKVARQARRWQHTADQNGLPTFIQPRAGGVESRVFEPTLAAPMFRYGRGPRPK